MIRVPSGVVSVALLAFLLCLAGAAAAAELQERTNKAYDAYIAQARTAFLSRIQAKRATGGTAEGVLAARAAREDGILNVTGGLIHHWVGAAFVRGPSLRDVLNVSTAYSKYSSMYKSVIGSRLVSKQGDVYHVLTRLKEGEAGITAVLDIESAVQYTYPSPGIAHILSSATQIREVRNAGERDEHLLPPGRDSGYLWRANTFTYLREQDGGVYVEMETVGLSRPFPRMLGWLIEPIARRLGRKSVEASLQEFLAAIRAEAAE